MEVLVFKINEEELAIAVTNVREVVKPQTIHPFPQSPAFVEGVINLRGHIIAVIDLRKKINASPIEDNQHTRIIICSSASSKIPNKRFVAGLIVDRVVEIINVTLDDIYPTPDILALQIKNSSVTGIIRISRRVIMLLNLERLITTEEIEQLQQTYSAAIVQTPQAKNGQTQEG